MAQWAAAQRAYQVPDLRAVQWFCSICGIAVKNMKFRFCKRCSVQFFPPSRKCSTCNQPCHGKQCRGCYARRTGYQKCATEACSAWRQRDNPWCRQCYQNQQPREHPPEFRHRDRSRRRDRERHGHRKHSRHDHDRHHDHDRDRDREIHERREHEQHEQHGQHEHEERWRPTQNQEVVSDAEAQSSDTQLRSEMARQERDVDALVEDEEGIIYDSDSHDEQ